MKRILAIFVFAAGFQPLVGEVGQAKEPIYIYLRSHVSDHVNIDISEDQLHRLLPMVERYRKEHPDSRISATVFFSGAVSQALAGRNQQSHIVDFVKSYIKRGFIEAAYDGSDEPTYASRPIVDLVQKSTPQERWLQRRAAEERFLSEGRDPLTGTPQPGKAGGLKAMQMVFGDPACITGLTPLMKYGPGAMFGAAQTKADVGLAPKILPPPSGMNYEVGDDTEAVVSLARRQSKAIMIGILDTNIAHLPGFGGGRSTFGRLMSPVPESAPELYWQDNVLRVSEASETVRLFHPNDGLEAVKKAMAKMDRSRVHVIQVELASEQNYLKPEFIKGPEYPALKYAYSHVQDPQLPAASRQANTDVDTAFANEQTVLDWMTNDLLNNENDGHFVSTSDLVHLVAPSNGFVISVVDLQKASADYLKEWGNNTYAPPLFRAGGHYLSSAELFQLLADALAEFHRTQKLPVSVQVLPVYGPVRVLTGHGPNEGEVSVAEVARVAAETAPALHDQSAGDIPKNSIPIGVTVNGTTMNPMQFLKLMAQAVVNPVPDAKLKIRMVYELTAQGELLPKSRPAGDNGYVWTLKPAQLQLPNHTTP